MELSGGVTKVPLVRRLTAGGWFRLAALVLAMFSVIAVVAGATAISRLSDARERVIDGYDPASRAAAQLLNAYLNQETGVRGFALSGQSDFLEPYRRGRLEQRRQAAALAGAIAQLHDARLRDDLAKLLTAGRTWQGGYAEPTIGMITRNGRDVSKGAANSGRMLFDGLRSRAATLQRHIAAGRVTAKGRLNRSAHTLRNTFITIAVLLLIGGAGVLLGLRFIVTDPVARLARRTRRVASGDFEHPVQADGPRDIAALGGDVESMRERIVAELGERERAREALDAQRTELERSNAELEQFAYVASHDLQEPLRKIASFTQLLQKRYGAQLDDQADAYLDFAADGAKRMQQLINDLLAFSRVGRKSSGESTVFDLDDSLDQALRSLGSALEDSSAQVVRDDLPRVRGEPALLAAVFQNLVGNAVKFRAPDTPPRVEIAVQREDAMWHFTCTDNGIGVPPEYADRIFIIFQRLHAKDAYGGTGIGLALCRKIVEYHGGEIWLAPGNGEGGGEGSTFHFTLPVIDEDDNEPA